MKKLFVTLSALFVILTVTAQDVFIKKSQINPILVETMTKIVDVESYKDPIPSYKRPAYGTEYPYIAFGATAGYVASQIDLNPNDWEDDKLNHFTAGYMIGFAVNGLSYHLLTKHTNMHLKWCKATSTVFGALMAGLAGHLKEDHDMHNGGFYSQDDLYYTFLGGCMGSFTVRMLIGKGIPEHRFPMSERIKWGF